MLVYERNSLVDEIIDLTTNLGTDRSALLPILQALQLRHKCISDFAQQEVARQLSIHPVEVFSVISFYSFLHPESQGRNIIRLCQTISCDLAGKCDLVNAIQRELGIKFGQSTKDKRIKLEFTNCLGMCDQGPALVVNERVYTKVTPERAINILNEVK